MRTASRYVFGFGFDLTGLWNINAWSGLLEPEGTVESAWLRTVSRHSGQWKRISTQVHGDDLTSRRHNIVPGKM